MCNYDPTFIFMLPRGAWASCRYGFVLHLGRLHSCPRVERGSRDTISQHCRSVYIHAPARSTGLLSSLLLVGQTGLHSCSRAKRGIGPHPGSMYFRCLHSCHQRGARGRVFPAVMWISGFHATPNRCVRSCRPRMFAYVFHGANPGVCLVHSGFAPHGVQIIAGTS